ncbi:MAG: GTP 3',8-cyclase MoaA [Treponema sp.]|nr:GTP 3',8-cyclase MoaA [Treponema sp.]
MIDPFNRTIDYMRISITDRCNLRCVYCMPQKFRSLPETDILSYEEILRVCTEAASLGIHFIKITGGEPLLREGVSDLVRQLKHTPGIRKVSLTTNGVLLSRYLDALCAAGIDGITISLDSLDAERFRLTTGYNSLDTIIQGIHESLSRTIKVKINAVLMDNGGGLQSQWRDLVELARALPLDVRFIEMMPIGYGRIFKAVAHDRILQGLHETYAGIREDRASRGAGPAVYYRIPGFKGAIGFISALSHRFCRTCNRIRLTAEGMVKPCLCYASGIDLKAILRDPAKTNEAVCQALKEAVAMKPAAHCFIPSPQAPEGSLEKRAMVAIGG